MLPFLSCSRPFSAPEDAVAAAEEELLSLRRAFDHCNFAVLQIPTKLTRIQTCTNGRLTRAVRRCWPSSAAPRRCAAHHRVVTKSACDPSAPALRRVPPHARAPGMAPSGASGRAAASAVSALRRLHRARLRAFRGDDEMLRASAAAVREQFAAGAGASGAAAERKVAEAVAAAEFLEGNVVQNRLNPAGNYEIGKGGIEVVK